MDVSSDDSLDDASKSSRRLRNRKTSTYGVYKKKPFLPPGVSRNTPQFKYVPCFRNEDDDKVEKERQLKLRSTIQKRPFLPVGKTTTSFNVNFQPKTPLWEKALRKRKNEFQSKLKQAVKDKRLIRSDLSKPVIENPPLRLAPVRDVGVVMENFPSKPKSLLKSSNKYINLAKSKLIKSPKIENIKKCAISTPFTQCGISDIKSIGNFSLAANREILNTTKKTSKLIHPNVGTNKENNSNQNFHQANVKVDESNRDVTSENKTPGQLRYSLRERKNTPNYSDLFNSRQTSTNKKKKGGLSRSKLIQDMNMYQKEHMNKSDAAFIDHHQKEESYHNLFTSTESMKMQTILPNLLSPKQLKVANSHPSNDSFDVPAEKDISAANSESNNGSWFYPPSPMDDIIVSKRRSHFKY